MSDTTPPPPDYADTRENERARRSYRCAEAMIRLHVEATRHRHPEAPPK